MSSLSADFSYPSQLHVEIPSKVSGLRENVSGTLNVSRQGYVYASDSHCVTWLKFLALALYLPVYGCAAKCREMAQSCFSNYTQPNKPALKHFLHLSGIACKAVIGSEGKTLTERVEEFALEELKFNHSDPKASLHLPRSYRLTHGLYMAKCMQPLFHMDQYNEQEILQDRIEQGYQTKELLKDALDRKQTWMPRWLSNNPYLEWDEKSLQSKLEEYEEKISSWEKLLDSSVRCKKYAEMAILSKNPTAYLKSAAIDSVTTTEAEVECLGERCYRQERICGILYKIDCCATRCWALDCFCCFCCFWPDARSCCLIA